MTFRLIALIVAGGIANNLAAQTPLAKVEERLHAILAPAAKASGIASHGPSARLTGKVLSLPEAPLPRSSVSPPSLPRLQAKSAEPRPLAEDVPLARWYVAPEPPQALVLATQPLARMWAWNTSGPLPMPIYSQGVRDRASLADPTLEASVALTQARLNPNRAQPVPFQVANLPDPFEHVEAVRLRQPLDEAPTPPLATTPPSRR